MITYTNNSPDSLPSLWIHMEQNIYRNDSRAQIVNGGPAAQGSPQPTPKTIPTRTSDGFVLDSVEIENGRNR